AIVNDELSSIGKCTPMALAESNIILAVSDPTDDAFTTVEAVAGGQNTITYNVSGRGTYTVYFMFRYSDMNACEKSTILPRGVAFSSVDYKCINHNNTVWKVMPHTTASNRSGGIHLVEVTVP